jgi:molybdopterin-guanine dinucleotide biosynthesis protein A
MSPRRVSVVILAGGRSSRFGRDKLAEPIDSRTLLAHVVDAVRPIATEIVVVAAPGAILPFADAGDVIVAHDPVAYQGPLAGLLAGLEVADEPVALVVGGDMPTLVGAVLRAMLEALDSRGVDAVVLEDAGRSRPLPMALRREPALAAVERLVEAGERRLRALPETLTTDVIASETWRVLDPGALTLRDIDTPADLG